MSPFSYLKPEFKPDAFTGTAVYYSRYRVQYPKILFEDLIKRTAPPPVGKLLDLASGTGRIAIPLASRFSQVWANDVDSDMIAVGKVEAKKYNVRNIEWLIGKAEEIKMEPDSIDLITIGEAFHRLDQNLITNLALRWLKPGGHIAIIGCYGILSGKELWHDIVKKIAGKFTSQNFSGTGEPKVYGEGMGPEHSRLALQYKRFDECDSYSFVFPHHWTIESIIGNLYSTSLCSKKVLGDNAEEFESEIKTALKKIDKRGHFFENIRCGYTHGIKPLLTL
jgi:SAM-dependent methyltransferase